MRIVFMGTPDFAAASLKKLIDKKYDIAAVFTQPDKPRDRGMKLSYSPVKELALENNIPVYQPTKLRDGTATELIKSLDPDILVVVAYGRILPDDMLCSIYTDVPLFPTGWCCHPERFFPTQAGQLAYL